MEVKGGGGEGWRRVGEGQRRKGGEEQGVEEEVRRGGEGGAERKGPRRRSQLPFLGRSHHKLNRDDFQSLLHQVGDREGRAGAV